MGFRKYHFKAKNLPVLTRETVNSWCISNGIIRTTLSLGVDYEYIKIKKNSTRIRGYEYDYNRLKRIRRDYVYVLDKGNVYPLSYFRAGLYYKLYPIAIDKAPTIEISGIKMHRVSSTDPWMDAMKKIEILKIRRTDKVLDICTGLGYTAINAYNYSPYVTTIEMDKNVLEMATYNPWSKELENIQIILEDAYKVVEYMESSSFDVIIHDPPRFSRAGHLYSLDFYRAPLLGKNLV